MSRKKRNVILNLCLCVAASMTTWAACDEESASSESENEESNISVSEYEGTGPYAVISYVGESQFLGVLDSLAQDTYTVAEAHEVDSQAIAYRNGKLYLFPHYAGNSSDIEVYRITEDNDLVLEGKLTTPAGSIPMDIVFVDDERAYLSLSESGVIWEIDLTTLEKTAKIDLTEYAIDDEDTDTPSDKTPNPSNLVIKDGKLYVALSQSYNSMMMGRDGMHMAVIDMDTNTVEKVFSDLDRGLSYAGNVHGSEGATFVDEKGDLYIPATGSWGYISGHKAGYLRVKAGETEFDPDWKIDFSEHDLSIDGETVVTDYLHYSVYAGNGIVYGTGHIPAHDSNPPDWVNDRSFSVVKVDLYNQTVEALPLPAAGAYGSDLTMDGDYLVAPLLTTAGSGVYVYDTTTGEAVTEPVFWTEGSVMIIQKIP